MLKDLTEECYREKDPAFVKFVECYAPGKTDDNLKDLIIGLYQAAMSHPIRKNGWSIVLRSTILQQKKNCMTPDGCRNVADSR